MAVPPLSFGRFFTSVKVGATGAGVTVTITDLTTELPLPVHESVNWVVVCGETGSLPSAGFAPLHPSDAVQVSAFVESHVKVELLPSSMVVGFAVKSKVGAGGGGGVVFGQGFGTNTVIGPACIALKHKLNGLGGGS